MVKREFEGKDLEEALKHASEGLGVAEPDLDYEIVEQGRRGLWGIGAKSVRIRIMPPVQEVPEDLGLEPARIDGGPDESERPEQEEGRSGRRRRGRGKRSDRADDSRQGAAGQGGDEDATADEQQAREGRDREARDDEPRRRRRRSRRRGRRGGRAAERAGGDADSAARPEGDAAEGGEGTRQARGEGDSRRRRRGRRRRGGRGADAEHVRRDNREDREPREPAEPESSERAAEHAPNVAETVDRMFSLMELDVTSTANANDIGVSVELDGEDRELLVDKDAEGMSALQFLLNRMARRTWPDSGRIQVTINGFGRKRDEEVVELVREVAGVVSRTGEAKRLHPMNAYERRLAHLPVREYEDLRSRSEGNGLLKKVRILKK